MPKRRTEDVVHVVMTDHLIQRRPPAGELLAMRKERPDTAGSAYSGPVVLYYPQSAGKSSDLYLAVAQVKQYSNLTEGTASLSRLLARRPDAPAPAHLELADALAHRGDLAQAVPHFEEALRKSPDLRPALLGLVQTLTKLSRFDRARRLLQQRLEKAPADAAAWNALGLILVQTNSLPEAIQAFRKSTSLEPEYVEALHNCGAALLQAGDRGASEAMFREAIRLDPGFARSHLELAGLVSDFAEAEYHFRKAILHDPNPAPAHFRYGAALAGEERYSEAARQFESAIASDPKLAEAYVGLGDMLALDGKNAPAAAQYRRALQLKPNLEPARVGLQMTAPTIR
jgi:tetratricopeptide (TPR) repeat protein